QDLTGAFLAATYQLLRQDGHAGSLIGASRFDEKRAADYQFYDDGLTHDAMLLYLIARHFPERMGGLKAQAIDAIVTPIEHGLYNRLSSAYSIMALDARPVASWALVAVLPGGFKVVAHPPGTVTLAPMATRRTGNEGEGEGEGEGEHAASAWTPNFGEAVGSWLPGYAEVRADRVNVYGLADASAREFVYKVKATAAGSFAVPPAHGEGMYGRG